ncbi:MAG: carbamoyltransferase HypF [Lachnospiraceae bacterium]|nr:carbamoyltransferase HypF [Lachnospiraceae bacterium]
MTGILEKITVTGAVQGIGYRPFVRSLADEYGISGCVRNSGGIVTILVTAGADSDIAAFCTALQDRAPAGAVIMGVERSAAEPGEKLPALPEHGFVIEESEPDRMPELAVFVPDLAPCDACLAEMRDPSDRRHSYPLISCTSCGPRYTILNAFPYDRERTTMREFGMCRACAAEYAPDGTGPEDPTAAPVIRPRERRRHAQTISCRDCGPQMYFIPADSGKTRQEGDAAVREAVRVLLAGGVVGLKGIGGFQLLALPGCAEAVRRIREMKGREAKPFAVEFSSIEEIKEYCAVSEAEEEALLSPARPIVLLRPAAGGDGRTAGWDGVLGDSAFIGVFLAASGAHQLLTDACGPLVATSANVSGEPMSIREEDFIGRFMDPGRDARADGVLSHPRRILSPVDDSVLFFGGERSGEAQFIRRARGYVPLPVITRISGDSAERRPGRHGDILAFGADMKAAFAMARGERIIVSQPFGDLEELSVRRAYLSELERLIGLYGLEPRTIVCDAHPGYHSTSLAEHFAAEHGLAAPVRVFHHYAHALSVMAQRNLASCAAIVCDGTGYGTDGTVWGGEVLVCSAHDQEPEDPGFTRAWHLPAFRLIGGDAGARDAELSAASLLLSAGRDLTLLHLEKDRENTIRAAYEAGAGVLTTSCGRLFDAAASLLAVSRVNRFEGECAQRLEAQAHRYLRGRGTALADEAHAFANISLEEFLERLLSGEWTGCDPGRPALCFHVSLAHALARAAADAAESAGERDIVLAGGCFANRLLLDLVIRGLEERGLHAVTGNSLPAGDGGISAGQAYRVMKETGK